MDATTAAAKAVGVAPSADAGNAPSSQRSSAPTKPVPWQEEEPLPAAAADMAPPTATTTTTSAECGGEDEQVEKFYALLDNIRAMRGMYARGNAGAGASADDSAGEVFGGVGGRKRARWAEQPWRPAFRMEDFEEAPGGRASEKDRRDDEGAATSRRPGKGHDGRSGGGRG